MKTKIKFQTITVCLLMLFLSNRIQAQMGATHIIQNNKACDVWVVWETVDINDQYINGVALPNFVVIGPGSSITVNTLGTHDIYVMIVGEFGMTPAQAHSYHQAVNGNIIMAPPANKPNPNDGGSAICGPFPYSISWTTAQTTIN